MNASSRFIPIFLLLAAIAGSAQAQGVRYGFQFGPSQPQGELKRAHLMIGISGGLSLIVDLGRGQALRPRVDYSDWDGDSGSGFFGPSDIKANAYGLGADYLFHFSGESHGFYLLGGLGFQKNSVINRRGAGGVFPRPEDWNQFGSGNSVYYALGLGYQHNDLFGTELRYTASKPSIGGVNMQFNTLNLGFTFRWGK